MADQPPHKRRWRLSWCALYPLAGLAILFHQTVVAPQAQYALLAVGLILCGLPVTLSSDRWRRILGELLSDHERDGGTPK